MGGVRTNLELPFRLGKTVPGTRSYHYFSASSESKVCFKRISFDPEFEGKFSFEHISATRVSINDCKPMCFVACLYDGFWCVGMILAVDEQNQEIKVNFMHPHGPANSFFWPRRKDICWAPSSTILCLINTPSTGYGRWFTLLGSDIDKINKYD